MPPKRPNKAQFSPVLVETGNNPSATPKAVQWPQNRQQWHLNNWPNGQGDTITIANGITNDANDVRTSNDETELESLDAEIEVLMSEAPPSDGPEADRLETLFKIKTNKMAELEISN